jgi:hypothetical protein
MVLQVMVVQELPALLTPAVAVAEEQEAMVVGHQAVRVSLFLN